jgi:hypothetical protein
MHYLSDRPASIQHWEHICGGIPERWPMLSSQAQKAVAPAARGCLDSWRLRELEGDGRAFEEGRKETNQK